MNTSTSVFNLKMNNTFVILPEVLTGNENINDNAKFVAGMLQENNSDIKSNTNNYIHTPKVRPIIIKKNPENLRIYLRCRIASLPAKRIHPIFSRYPGQLLHLKNWMLKVLNISFYQNMGLDQEKW